MFRVGDTVRLTRDLYESGDTPYAGDIGWIVERHDLYPSRDQQWLVRFATGTTNGSDDGWWVRESQMEKIDDDT